MTPEEKARAYDEALESIKKFLAEFKRRMPKDVFEDAKTIFEDNFPELQESEDEKVKRTLRSISSKMSFHLQDIFTEEEFQCFDAWSNAWLEKQGESKWTDEDEELLQHCCGAVAAADYYTMEDKKEMENWLKSLKRREKGKGGQHE